MRKTLLRVCTALAFAVGVGAFFAVSNYTIAQAAVETSLEKFPEEVIKVKSAPLEEYRVIHQYEIFTAEYIPPPPPPPPPVPKPEPEPEPEVAAVEEQSFEAPLYSGGGSKDDWLRESGIAEADWGYVDYIVNRESSWNPNAVNSSSGASGLVQALPCGKVPGSCFNPVDNLRWADSYAKDRYGSWAGAYDFWVANSWW